MRPIWTSEVVHGLVYLKHKDTYNFERMLVNYEKLIFLDVKELYLCHEETDLSFCQRKIM